MKRYKQIALDNRVWLSLGGFHETCVENPTKRYSTLKSFECFRYSRHYFRRRQYCKRI